MGRRKEEWTYINSSKVDTRLKEMGITRKKLAKELLGFEPEVSFPEGLRETLDWYKVNQSI